MDRSALERAFEILNEAVDTHGDEIPDALRFVAEVLSLYYAEMDTRGAHAHFSEEVLREIVAEALEYNNSDISPVDARAAVHRWDCSRGDRVRERRGSVSGCANPFSVSLAESPKTKDVFDLLMGVLKGTRLIARTMSHEQLARLVSTMKPEEVKEGEQIITEGEYGNAMYIVERGEFCILKDGNVEAVLKERRLFGEISMLYSFPRTATVRCMKDALVWVCTSDVYTAILTLDGHKIREAVSRVLEEKREYAVLPVEVKNKIMMASSLIHYREDEAPEKEDPGVFMALENTAVLSGGRQVEVRKGEYIPPGAVCSTEVSMVFFPIWSYELFRGESSTEEP
jgi:CRP-like cAMP-binding protein